MRDKVFYRAVFTALMLAGLALVVTAIAVPPTAVVGAPVGSILITAALAMFKSKLNTDTESVLAQAEAQEAQAIIQEREPHREHLQPTILFQFNMNQGGERESPKRKDRARLTLA